MLRQKSLRTAKRVLITATLAMLVPSVAVAELPANPGFSTDGLMISQGLPPLQGRVVTAPAGSFMTATVQSPITSEYARPGDRFNATLGSAVSSGGVVVLPAGSQLEGQVVSSTRARRGGRNGKLDIRFTSAITPNGQRIPISARIQTEDGTGIIKGGSTKGAVGKAVLRTGVGAGAGAALGTAMGAVSGGKVGRGAVYGTAIGGGLGAIYAGAKKGKEAVLPAGQPLNIVLDAPVTVTPAPAYGQGGGYNTGGYGQGGYGAGGGGYNQAPPYNASPYSQPQQTPYGQPSSPYGGGYGQPSQPTNDPYGGGGGYNQPSQPSNPYGDPYGGQQNQQPSNPYGNGNYYGQ